MMRMDSDQFLDKAALEAMHIVGNGDVSIDHVCEILGIDSPCRYNSRLDFPRYVAKMSFEFASEMVKERKRLMDEQKKTKVSEKFGKLPEVE